VHVKNPDGEPYDHCQRCGKDQFIVEWRGAKEGKSGIMGFPMT
jgi:hypothetical protein